MDKITTKQELFCKNYILNGFNGTDAYLISFGIENRGTARTMASKLLSNANIMQRIQELKELSNEKFKIDKEYLTSLLVPVAELNAGDLVEMNEDGDGFNLKLSMSHKLKGLTGVSSSKSNSSGPEGSSASRSWNISTRDKMKAIEILARIHGIGENAAGNDPDKGNGRSTTSRILKSLTKFGKGE